MGKPSSNLRLFVAAYPPAPLINSALHALSDLTLPPHRIVPADNVHLTLQFIGDTPARALDSLCESFARAAAGIAPFTLQPIRLVALPEKSPARLIALLTSAPPALLELHHRLVTRFASNPRKSPRADFLPHLTLCRFITPRFDFSLPPLHTPCVAALPPFNIDCIHLMRTTLAPSGALHHALASIPLQS